MFRNFVCFFFIPAINLLTNGSLSTPVWANDSFTTLNIARPTSTIKAPGFTLPTLDGTTVSSADLRGRVVILNFWATWCGPCKEEMPALNRLQQKFSPEKFTILAVTTDIQPKAIQSFWNLFELDMDVLLDESQEFSQQLMVRGLPTTVIIGRDGTLLGRAMGPRAWDSPEAIALIRHLLNIS